MGVSQIIKENDGSGRTTVTVITNDGNTASNSYYDYQANSTQDDIVADTVKEALDKD